MKRQKALLQAAALRTARQCRRIVQGCLREEEWADADAEFCAIILRALQRLRKSMKRNSLNNGEMK